MTGAEVVVASAVGDPVEESFVFVPAEAEPLTEGDGSADAEPDDFPVPDGRSARAASGAEAPPDSVGTADSPVVDPVRSSLSWAPPDGEPEKENPAISAAAETAPTAPAATATRRFRQADGFRRDRRPPREAPSPTFGSSAVSSYVFCQP
ncbi:hypothetical protein ACFV7R_14450 [Streptomyces sp. NPDC059866]|uniref:hypothetical protein n=1 Tax=Streptomyces sp. NPDC059866 TaxID=3346978 RepID=UPI0036563CAB